MTPEDRIKEVRAYVGMAVGVGIICLLAYNQITGNLTVGEFIQYFATLAGTGSLANGLALWRQSKNGNENLPH